MYKRIAVVMDGSAESSAAVKEACMLAQAHSSESVTLVTVLPERKLLKAKEKGQDKAILPSEVMAGAAAELDGAGIANETVLLSGKLADAIGRYARESRIELIVVGSKAFQKVIQAMSGQSNDTSNTHKLGCPVMVVKGHAKTDSTNQRQGLREKGEAKGGAAHV